MKRKGSMDKRFERFVFNLYKVPIIRLARHNVHINGRQIDVVTGLFNRHYIECKYREDNNVKEEQVSKFIHVLEHALEVPIEKGIMITNQDYEISGRLYAKNCGLLILNRFDLEGLLYTHLDQGKCSKLWKKIKPFNEKIRDYELLKYELRNSLKSPNITQRMLNGHYQKKIEKYNQKISQLREKTAEHEEKLALVRKKKKVKPLEFYIGKTKV